MHVIYFISDLFCVHTLLNPVFDYNTMIKETKMAKIQWGILKNEKCSKYFECGYVGVLTASEIASQNRVGSYVYDGQRPAIRK